MNDQNTRRRRRLSLEIVGLLGVSIVISLFWFQLLRGCAYLISVNYFAWRDVVLTDAQVTELEDWLFHLSLLVSVGFFLLLFLFLLGERLSYIREIIKGIHALRSGQEDYVVPVEGRNELTQLAEAVNYLSETQRQVREEERGLQEEKEKLIRTLSHDIRTPLTSIMAYSELLIGEADADQEQRSRLELIRKKAEQIKELTDILLDGGRRNVETFEDASLLMEQLAAEFQEVLEDEYCVSVELTGCGRFGGSFDVQELRRIFDNLISNIQKYADSEYPVLLNLAVTEGGLAVRQSNYILAEPRQEGKRESYQIGLNSIRRIAHNYGGRVDVIEDGEIFEITVTLSEI